MDVLGFGWIAARTAGKVTKIRPFFGFSLKPDEAKAIQNQGLSQAPPVHLGMRKTIPIILLLAWSLTAQAQRIPAHVYVVRHAEKAEGKNPPLSQAGHQRAGDLYRAVRGAGIQQIYVSQYLRSAQTADSLRIYLGIDTVHYMADDSGDGLMQAVQAQGSRARTILVIAHSNTIPTIIKRFGTRNPLEASIPDEQYDQLYYLNRTRRTVIMQTRSFGNPSPTAAPTYQMNRD